MKPEDNYYWNKGQMEARLSDLTQQRDHLLVTNVILVIAILLLVLLG